jgi:glycosyltransferase involved in cell wall biosynthesis
VEPLETREAGLSIVIPAWNEEARLAKTLAAYIPALRASGVKYEVVVACDGLTDHTSAVAESYRSSGVRTLESAKKRGKGGAVLAGIRAARFASVGFVDADGPVPPEDLLRLAKALDQSDCAIASRVVPGSKSMIRRSALRRLLSRLWGLAVRVMLLIPVDDPQCGAKFFRAEAIGMVMPRVQLTNWAFDISILFHLHDSGFRISEVPVTWTERSGSKLVISKDVPAMFVSLVGLRIMNSPLGELLNHLRLQFAHPTLR